MYAIVEYKGNQYKAEKDAVLTVDRIDEAKEAKPGDTITLDKVLLVSDGDKVTVGTPYVQGAKVTVEVGKTFKDSKVLVLKYKSKKDYHRLIGHREQYTDIVVSKAVPPRGMLVLLPEERTLFVPPRRFYSGRQFRFWNPLRESICR